jgi:hypothetical protein
MKIYIENIASVKLLAPFAMFILLAYLPGCSEPEESDFVPNKKETLEVEFYSPKKKIDVAQVADTKKLAKELKIIGEINKAITWTYEKSEYLVVFSNSVTEAEDFIQILNINCSIYQKTQEKYTLIWKHTDSEENDCDLGRSLVSDIAIDDIDSDGNFEMAFIYQIIGNCDVSPENFTLILYADNETYRIEGTNKVTMEDSETFGGELLYSNNFETAPIQFKEFAYNFWNKYIKDIELTSEGELINERR